MKHVAWMIAVVGILCVTSEDAWAKKCNPCKVRKVKCCKQTCCTTPAPQPCCTTQAAPACCPTQPASACCKVAHRVHCKSQVICCAATGEAQSGASTAKYEELSTPPAKESEAPAPAPAPEK